MRSVIDRFLEYVRVDTRSVQPAQGVDEVHPSSPNQRVLAGTLEQELKGMGVPDEYFVRLKDASFLVCFPPTEGCEKAPHIVYAVHLDTYFGCPGGANPIVHEYHGGDICLPNDGIIIPAKNLAGLEGKRIITADGSTLLGGDDKAGVAAVMTFIEEMMTQRSPHGPLTVWFCTDEEIGAVGVKFLPEGMAEQWDFFWTIDGKNADEIDIGCFYGAKVDVKFCGNDAHPGIAGQELKPAHYAASRFIDKLADGPSPWTTVDEESFIYVPAFPAGSAGETLLTVYPRTFRKDEIPGMEATIRRVAEEAASRYGVTAVVSKAELMYVSTEVAIDANRGLLQPGIDALEEFGITPKLQRVRAGTDGAMLNMTHPNIPAPNLGTGARNLHGKREFLVADELEVAPRVLMSMVQRYARMARQWSMVR